MDRNVAFIGSSIIIQLIAVFPAARLVLRSERNRRVGLVMLFVISLGVYHQSMELYRHLAGITLMDRFSETVFFIISLVLPAGIFQLARLIATMEQRERELDEQTRLAALRADIGVALASSDSLRTLLSYCTEALVKYLDAAFARIWTFNADEGMLELQASSGLYTHIDGAHGRVPVGKYKIGLIAEERRPHLTNSVIGDPRIHDQTWARKEGMVAFAGHPLLLDDKLVGVMALFSRKPLGDITFKALSSIADQVALGIERKWTEKALEEAHRELERRVEERTAELQSANERLEEANKELDSFTSSVSHDLRAPLRVIEGYSRAIQEDYADRLDDAGKNLLQRMHKSVQRMAQLIYGLLSLSRLSRGAVNRGVVDLSALATAIAQELRLSQPDRQVQFTIAEGLTAEGDAVMLQMVIDNLLRNAWKFTSKKDAAHVEFDILEAGGKPVYFVRDNGAGFDMQYAENLFAAFKRLHGENEFSGTGIGLATVQRIITRHGGRIWATAEVGEGATFYFTLS